MAATAKTTLTLETEQFDIVRDALRREELHQNGVQRNSEVPAPVRAAARAKLVKVQSLRNQLGDTQDLQLGLRGEQVAG